MQCAQEDTSAVGVTSGVTTAGIGTSMAEPEGAQLVMTQSMPRLPRFHKEMPEVWFAQLEAHFEGARITADKVKYGQALQALDSEVAKEVYPLIVDPPATGRYPALKAAVLKIYQQTELSKMRRLLSETNYIAGKPSSILRQMQSLAGAHANESIVKSIWLQRLPPSIQAILMIHTGDLQQMAEMADRIQDVMANNGNVYSHTSYPATSDNAPAQTVCSVQTTYPAQPAYPAQPVYPAQPAYQPQRSTTEVLMQSILERLDRLEVNLSAVRSQLCNTGNRSFVRRPRSRSPSANRNRLCQYHRRFGANAHRCIQPCAWANAQNTTNSASGNAHSG